jgi:hypothetical protein
VGSVDIDPGTAGRRTDDGVRYRYVGAALIPRVTEARTVGRFTFAIFQVDCKKRASEGFCAGHMPLRRLEIYAIYIEPRNVAFYGILIIAAVAVALTR